MNQYVATHYLEICATVTGLISVYLVGRENIWNWVFGLVCVSLYCIIFYRVKLYADMGLQVIFFALQFYGLYQWLFGGQQRSALTIRSATLSIYLSVITSSIALFLVISYLLQHFTDSTTVYIDAFTTALSIVAQALMGRKWLQHWFIWMTVDVISIRMYLMKDLYLTSGLYLIYLCLCVVGYIRWHKQYSRHALSKEFSLV